MALWCALRAPYRERQRVGGPSPSAVPWAAVPSPGQSFPPRRSSTAFGWRIAAAGDAGNGEDERAVLELGGGGHLRGLRAGVLAAILAREREVIAVRHIAGLGVARLEGLRAEGAGEGEARRAEGGRGVRGWWRGHGIGEETLVGGASASERRGRARRRRGGRFLIRSGRASRAPTWRVRKYGSAWFTRTPVIRQRSCTGGAMVPRTSSRRELCRGRAARRCGAM